MCSSSYFGDLGEDVIILCLIVLPELNLFVFKSYIYLRSFCGIFSVPLSFGNNIISLKLYLQELSYASR